MGYQKVVPIYDPKVLALCRGVYPGHPKGCPNWNKKKDCPPKARRLPDILDLTYPVFVIWNEFNLAAHVEKMRVHQLYHKIRVDQGESRFLAVDCL